ncbi:NADP-dependent oxidoreductase [Amycolatopsis sp. 195334CR]|uniref:NADP-dependent oxidoreductase n=1 Tax=Amycolatopsis sp. 195334CR TaxID=2814588 RepID=UPI001A8EAE36|nr:NADP-dependent oxidoreductase [Amycolatopsis sp. 195334CR]MBN6038189.1 NADP-dependent oxidoreductase [Amycolatopsis sp. 195334CR]
MRAIQITEYGPPSVLRVAEVPVPHAGPGEIRIEVRASGLAAGDVRIRSGELREVAPIELPYLTGFDAAGVVDEVGEGVTGVRVGDEVFGGTSSAARGANSDYAVLGMWAPKPAAWSWEEAGGAAGSVETATRVFDRLALGAGQTVLVQGAAGGVGTVAVQLAVARGAKVVGTAREQNHDLVRSLGAEPVTYGPGLAGRLPSTVDFVLDCAGRDLPQLVAITGDPARVVTIADLAAHEHGVYLSHTAPMAGADTPAPHGLATATALAAEGRLRVPVAATFPLADAAAAHELSENRRAGGKIVLLP